MKMITLSDINAVKKRAKAAKKTDQSLSYMQWLDRVAKENYQVSGFYELQTICDNSLLISRDIEDQGDGLVYCKFCGFTFVAQPDCDCKEHKKWHRQYEEFLSAMGYLPQHHDRREATKRQGYRLMSSADAEQQRNGALAVLAGHFDRSLSGAIDGGYWRGHPAFDEYIAMALPAAGFIPAHIKSRLVTEFGEKPGFSTIPIGSRGKLPGVCHPKTAVVHVRNCSQCWLCSVKIWQTDTASKVVFAQ